MVSPYICGQSRPGYTMTSGDVDISNTSVIYFCLNFWDKDIPLFILFTFGLFGQQPIIINC